MVLLWSMPSFSFSSFIISTSVFLFFISDLHQIFFLFHFSFLIFNFHFWLLVSFLINLRIKVNIPSFHFSNFFSSNFYFLVMNVFFYDNFPIDINNFFNSFSRRHLIYYNNSPFSFLFWNNCLPYSISSGSSSIFFLSVFASFNRYSSWKNVFFSVYWFITTQFIPYLLFFHNFFFFNSSSIFSFSIFNSHGTFNFLKIFITFYYYYLCMFVFFSGSSFIITSFIPYFNAFHQFSLIQFSFLIESRMNVFPFWFSIY